VSTRSCCVRWYTQRRIKGVSPCGDVPNLLGCWTIGTLGCICPKPLDCLFDPAWSPFDSKMAVQCTCSGDSSCRERVLHLLTSHISLELGTFELPLAHGSEPKRNQEVGRGALEISCLGCDTRG
jgi:hypothetical protein